MRNIADSLNTVFQIFPKAFSAQPLPLKRFQPSHSLKRL
jgi:hypothetical protein